MQEIKSSSFYLIDEKKIAGLSIEDRKLLDSCLSVYHSSDDERKRCHALETISESIDDKCIKPYRMRLESLLYYLMKESNKKRLLGIKK